MARCPRKTANQYLLHLIRIEISVLCCSLYHVEQLGELVADIIIDIKYLKY
jgi:hypothetical protein